MSVGQTRPGRQCKECPLNFSNAIASKEWRSPFHLLRSAACFAFCFFSVTKFVSSNHAKSSGLHHPCVWNPSQPRHKLAQRDLCGVAMLILLIELDEPRMSWRFREWRFYFTVRICLWEGISKVKGIFTCKCQSFITHTTKFWVNEMLTWSEETSELETQGTAGSNLFFYYLHMFTYWIGG